MTIVLLMMLAAVWVAVLLPPVLRKRAEVRPAASISSFRKQLIVLERTSPARQGTAGRPSVGLRSVPADGLLLLVPGGSSPARSGVSRVRRRRQNVLLALLAADAGALILVVVGVGVAAAFALVVTVGATAAYVSLLIRMQRLRVERRMKLRYLPRPVVIQPVIQARRSAAL